MVKKTLFTAILLMARILSVQAFQVVITEIMPDPEPAIGLPAEEFIELTNVSGKTIDISGWSISNSRTKAVIPDSVFLQDREIIITCHSSAGNQFESYGRAIGLQPFPILSNENDTLILRDKESLIIHAVAYSVKLYGNDLTASGRSLEMINVEKSCTIQNNWSPSKSTSGGTPGQPNNPSEIPRNDQQFTILYATCPSEKEFMLVFDDRIEAGVTDLTKFIQTNPAINIEKCSITGISGNQLSCILTKTLLFNQVIEIGADGLKSCLQYETGGTRRVKAGLPDAIAGKLVISEIMFDPPPDGADYLEIYNASGKIINLQEIRVGNRNSTGIISNKKSLSEKARYIFPGEYMAFTTNAAWLVKQYLVKDPAKIISVPTLPSWPNTRGTALLLTAHDSIYDELQYESDWHFELLRNTESVALERKDNDAPTQMAANWFSASRSAGYGTPGYANSQANADAGEAQNVWPEPSLFTPNQDGQDDQCYLHYKFDQSGFVLTTRIYNRSGVLVRTLVNNGLCGLSGKYAWDGKDDKKNQLPSTIYIAVTDIFSLTGKTRRYRHAITLGN